MDCNQVLLLRGNWQTENWIALRMHFISGQYVRRVRGMGGVMRVRTGRASPYQNDSSILCFLSVCFIMDFYRV